MVKPLNIVMVLPASVAREVTVLVRQGLHPECFFQMRFYNNTKNSEIRDIVLQWTRITGLRFDMMKCLDDTDTSSGHYAFRVEHPMDNRSAVYFIWPVAGMDAASRCTGCVPEPVAGT